MSRVPGTLLRAARPVPRLLVSDLVIVCLEHVEQSDDVLMVVCVEFLQEHDFSECSLCIGAVLECVEYLLERHCAARHLVHRLPHDSIRALAHALTDLVL